VTFSATLRSLNGNVSLISAWMVRWRHARQSEFRTNPTQHLQDAPTHVCQKNCKLQVFRSKITVNVAAVLSPSTVDPLAISIVKSLLTAAGSGASVGPPSIVINTPAHACVHPPLITVVRRPPNTRSAIMQANTLRQPKSGSPATTTSTIDARKRLQKYRQSAVRVKSSRPQTPLLRVSTIAQLPGYSHTQSTLRCEWPAHESTSQPSAAQVYSPAHSSRARTCAGACAGLWICSSVPWSSRQAATRRPVLYDPL
jgi:hypothetical protein